MSRPDTGATERLTLSCTKEAKETLERLRIATDSSSLTEVFRKSLALFDLVQSHTSEGNAVVLRYKDGHEEVLRLL